MNHDLIKTQFEDAQEAFIRNESLQIATAQMLEMFGNEDKSIIGCIMS